ncbi:MAG TPA: VOC family protein [Lachnospiraceae bacterium]|nr:VOC family protein [Lachnospiraceae bacterium]
MNLTKLPLFKYVDCIQLYIPDLQQGMDYYCNSLGLRIIWKTDTAVGLGTSEGITEIVIRTSVTP